MQYRETTTFKLSSKWAKLWAHFKELKDLFMKGWLSGEKDNF